MLCRTLSAGTNRSFMCIVGWGINSEHHKAAKERIPSTPTSSRPSTNLHARISVLFCVCVCAATPAHSPYVSGLTSLPYSPPAASLPWSFRSAGKARGQSAVKRGGVRVRCT
jgi:hypothetical protein